MEQNIAPRPFPVSSTSSRAKVETSLVDSLFAMPEGKTLKRNTREQKAESARLEARLAAEMRALIAARLRADDAG